MPIRYRYRYHDIEVLDQRFVADEILGIECPYDTGIGITISRFWINASLQMIY